MIREGIAGTFIMLAVFVAGCASGTYSAQAKSPPANPEEFSSLYLAVKIADTSDERVRVVAQILSSHMAYDEQIWLFLMMLKPGMSASELPFILPGGNWTRHEFGPPPCVDEQTYDFDYGIHVFFGGGDNIIQSVSVTLSKDRSSPGGIVPPWWFDESSKEDRMAAAQRNLNAVPAPGPPKPKPDNRDTALFCSLYRTALAARTLDERKAIASKVRESTLIHPEKAWLLFTLISPGMARSTVDELSGTPSSAKPSNQGRLYGGSILVTPKDPGSRQVESVTLSLMHTLDTESGASATVPGFQVWELP